MLKLEDLCAKDQPFAKPFSAQIRCHAPPPPPPPKSFPHQRINSNGPGLSIAIVGKFESREVIETDQSDHPKVMSVSLLSNL